MCAKTDEAAAQSLVGWFRQEGWLKEQEGPREIMQRGPYCNGCHGDRSVQWSGDCEIRACCVDAKHHTFCSECDSFPCNRLTEFGKRGPKYAAALERLTVMRKTNQA